MGLLRTFSRLTGPKTQVDKFFVKYRPPKDMVKEANKYQKLTDLWRYSKRSDWMLWMIACIEFKPAGGLRLFACFCARQFWELMTDPRSRAVVEVSEKFARGEATVREVEQARAAAYEVLNEAKRRNDKLGEALAWSAAATAKEDAFTAANDAAVYTCEVADLHGGRQDFYRVRELQANMLRQLIDNPFAED
jgi:hypothetical protein